MPLGNGSFDIFLQFNSISYITRRHNKYTKSSAPFWLMCVCKYVDIKKTTNTHNKLFQMSTTRKDSVKLAKNILKSSPTSLI